MNKKNKNKKGQMSTAMKIILVVVVLTLSILIYGKVMKGSTKILQCNKNGGDCVKGTCNWLTQLPALSDQAAGCKKDELCCINITQEVKEDPYCKDLKFGSPCRTDESPLYYCDKALTCVTKCEFCSINWGTTEAKGVCPESDIKFRFEKNNDPTHNNYFGCSCSREECSPAMKTAGKCVEQYCPKSPSGTPETYCCIKSAVADNTPATPVAK